MSLINFCPLCSLLTLTLSLVVTVLPMERQQSGPSGDLVSPFALRLALLELCCHHVTKSGLTAFRMKDYIHLGDLWEAVSSVLLLPLWKHNQASGSWSEVILCQGGQQQGQTP